jgi:hypothetical protein
MCEYHSRLDGGAVAVRSVASTAANGGCESFVMAVSGFGFGSGGFFTVVWFLLVSGLVVPVFRLWSCRVLLVWSWFLVFGWSCVWPCYGGGQVVQGGVAVLE